MDLCRLTLVEQRLLLEKREIQPLDLVNAYLERIDRLDNELHCLTQVFHDEARARAVELGAGNPEGPLWGIPWVAKDILVTRTGRTTCGSKLLENFHSPYDATVVTRIEAAGGVLLAKSNMDEFAMGSSTENSAFGATRNPWDPERVPGGSSGGSSAAVAARLCSFALGTDTGGSIRQPAAFCGVVGMKPTYGAVSRYGLVAFASSLDQIGPLTGTVRDAAAVLGVIAGKDSHDSTSQAMKAMPEKWEAAKDLSKMRFGVPRHLLDSGVASEVQEDFERTLSRLGDLGARCVDVELPSFNHAIAIYYVIAAAEASANLSRFDGVRYTSRPPMTESSEAQTINDLYVESRSAGFGPEVKRRILLGTYVLSARYNEAFYQKAQRARTLLQRDLDHIWQRCDYVVLPTSPCLPFKLGERVADPLAMYLSDTFTVPANLARLPAISLPTSRVSGLPLGVQLIAPRFQDGPLLQTAACLEGALKFEPLSLA